MAFETLLQRYDKLLIFDTKTTGLDCRRDEIIQFACAVITRKDGSGQVTETYDNLVQLSPGGFVSDYITRLTGISAADLRLRGLSGARVCCDVARLLEGNTLLIAYNAQFDLSFLYYLLLRSGDPEILRGKDKLDALTVFRDRRPGPHRLESAISAYRLGRKVKNSHRAMEDVMATAAVLEAMERERDDLHCYVNLFSHSSQYGSRPIASVTYRRHVPGKPLYEA